ncbi:amidase family protein, partial [Thermodesulfovibrionales bacterium]|nr:amidase family protein [Thermodesulfovibrionales bacterium]
MGLNELSISELRRSLRAQEIRPQEIIDDIYSRIDEIEDKVGSFITITRDNAYKSAEGVGKTIKEGHIAGIPIAIKDNLCTKGILTTCASKMLYNFVPPYESTVTKRLSE